MPDANEMPVKSPQSPQTWIPTSEAAARLGVSERTVLRRAKAGVFPSRKEATARGVMMWVCLEGADVPTGGAIGADTSKIQSGKGAVPYVPTGADKVPTDVPTGADTDFKAHLIAENAFLRGVIEQLQRDGAETRNALRKALEMAPKQLTAGADTPQNERGRQSASDIQNGPQNGAERDGGALTYDMIAEDLERRLNQ